MFVVLDADQRLGGLEEAVAGLPGGTPCYSLVLPPLEHLLGLRTAPALAAVLADAVRATAAAAGAGAGGGRGSDSGGGTCVPGWSVAVVGVGHAAAVAYELAVQLQVRCGEQAQQHGRSGPSAWIEQPWNGLSVLAGRRLPLRMHAHDVPTHVTCCCCHGPQPIPPLALHAQAGSPVGGGAPPGGGGGGAPTTTTSLSATASSSVLGSVASAPVLLLAEDARLRRGVQLAAQPWFQLHGWVAGWRPDLDPEEYCAVGRMLEEQVGPPAEAVAGCSRRGGRVPVCVPLCVRRGFLRLCAQCMR